MKMCIMLFALPMVLLAIREDLYQAKRPVVQRALCELWGYDTEDTNAVAWVDSGWKYYVQTNDTNRVWMLYDVTDLQTRDRATPERIQQWKDRLADVSRVRIVKVPDGDWQSLAREYGLKPVNESTNGIPQ